jgi:hypothetical protein
MLAGTIGSAEHGALTKALEASVTVKYSRCPGLLTVLTFSVSELITVLGTSGGMG